jgi:hypothetical protein
MKDISLTKNPHGVEDQLDEDKTKDTGLSKVFNELEGLRR